MKITKKETIFDGNYLGVVRKHFITDTGKECFWETIERKNIHNGGAVVIVPVTKKRELILERNWRVPIESFVVQFPAGLTDKKGESEEEAARRELLEETGYRAEKLIPIVSVPLCPALTSTRATHFFAPDVEFTGNTMRDATEEIEVLKVPLEELDHFLFNLPEGTELDLRVPGVLCFLEKKKLL